MLKLLTTWKVMVLLFFDVYKETATLESFIADNFPVYMPWLFRWQVVYLLVKLN